MGAYLYGDCGGIRKTPIPYSECGSSGAIKITPQLLNNWIPFLDSFRNSSSLNVDFVLSGESNSRISTHTQNIDFSGYMPRNLEWQGCSQALRDDGTLRTICYQTGLDALKVANLCDSYPLLSWQANGIAINDCVLDKSENECSGWFNDWRCWGWAYFNMCWHPTLANFIERRLKYVTVCSLLDPNTPGFIPAVDGVCIITIPSLGKTNHSCCNTFSEVGGFNKPGPYSLLRVNLPGLTLTPEGDFALYTPRVVLQAGTTGTFNVFSYGTSYNLGWPCQCTPIVIKNVLGDSALTEDEVITIGSSCNPELNTYYWPNPGCYGDLYMQGGPEYFPNKQINSTDLVYSGVHSYYVGGVPYFQPYGANPYKVDGRTQADSNASWRIEDGCWVYNFSNSYSAGQCGNQDFSIYMKICPGTVDNLPSNEGRCI